MDEHVPGNMGFNHLSMQTFQLISLENVRGKLERLFACSNVESMETFGYPGGYCTVPVGILRQSRYCGYCRWVLQGTVGAAVTVDASGYCTVPVGTAGYCGYCDS
jgi:hypothetical protein